MLMKTSPTDALTRAQFPARFLWGVATSSYQIEGAHDQDGRTPSVWDTFCHQPGTIADGSNGNLACDHYNRLEEDLDLIASLGVNAYRFSVSWSRVQPDGRGAWNETGFAFYARLLEGLASRGIEAHVTLNHWDLPQALQDRGGWANPLTSDAFIRYADEFHRRFAHRMHSLCTHNEPWVIAVLGHQEGVFAPGFRSRSLAMEVAHNLLVSHGRTLELLRKQGSKVPLGIVLNLSPIYPASDSEADRRKARLDDGLIARWYLDALFKGAYPEDVLEHLGADAPRFTQEDMAQIRQPLDFIGVNYYTRNFSSTGNPWDVHSTGNDVTDMGWEVYPQGLTELLCRMHRDYPLPRTLVTENGAAYKDELVAGAIDDAARALYIRDHIEATLRAREAGVPVEGYFAWSLLDNFEWASGYSKRFGIVHVDFETLQRTPKRSALWYRDFLKG